MLMVTSVYRWHCSQIPRIRCRTLQFRWPRSITTQLWIWFIITIGGQSYTSSPPLRDCIACSKYTKIFPRYVLTFYFTIIILPVHLNGSNHICKRADRPWICRTKLKGATYCSIFRVTAKDMLFCCMDISTFKAINANSNKKQKLKVVSSNIV